MSKQEILGEFRCTAENPMSVVSNYVLKGDSYEVIFTNDKMLLYPKKASLSSRLFGGFKPYNHLQASKRERLKKQKNSADKIKEIKESNPDLIEVHYSEIIVVELDVQPKKTIVKIFLDDEDLDTPDMELILPYKQEYKGEFREFFKSVMPNKI
ncbi:MAG: hypothetical protein ACQEQH_04995 [Bacillota bacterium]